MNAFVGRERELADLRAGLDAAFTGSGSFILVAGEPGIGKTRLANEIGREAVGRGARVLRGGNFESGGAPPYWPWIQVLRACFASSPSNARPAWPGTSRGLELRDLLPELSLSAGLEPDLARFRLFDAVAVALQSHWEAEPLVIFHDDLQWADESSLLLLQFLARDLSGTRMLILGAYRDVEAHDSPGIGRRIAALACDARTIQLGGLANLEVAEMIQRTTRQAFPEGVANAVHGATGGNPLFVDELVHSLAVEGRLDESMSLVRLPLPERVRAVIGRRTDHVSEECRRVLAVAAVIGRDFDYRSLSAVCVGSGDRPLESIDEAREAHIVTAAGNRFAFAHDLFRQALYDDLAAEKRRSLHADVGAALERLYAADLELHLAELAHHFSRAAPGSEKAIQYSVRAAERAAGQLAFEEAAGHYQAALQGLAASRSPDPARRCQFLLALAENLWKAGAFDEARRVYEEVAELGEVLNLPAVVARAALGFCGQDIGFDTLNLEPREVRLLEKGLAAIGPGDSLLRASLMARLGVAMTSSAQGERGAAQARAALEMARRFADKPTLHFVLSCFVCATWSPENLEERLAASGEMSRLSVEIGTAGVAEIHVSLVAHLQEAGDAAGAEREAQGYRRRTEVAGRRVTTWILALRNAMTALAEGRFEEVESLASQALRLGQETQHPGAAEYFGAQLIALRREQGRLAEVLGAVEGFAAGNPLPVWRAAAAWVYAELGRDADAQRELDRLAGAEFSDLPRGMSWLMCMWLLAEIVAKVGDSRRAETLYALLRPYRERCATVPMAFNGGSLERSLGLLAGTASRYGEAADHFEAAITANLRIGARPWVAHAEHEYARLLLARGDAADRARARDLLGQAIDTARALGMAELLVRAEPLLTGLVPAPDNAAVFRREGEYWTVGCGGSAARVRDARGLQLISLLLCSPGRDIPAVHLAVWPEPPPAPGADGRSIARELGLQPMGLTDDSAEPDARARSEYRARLEGLREEAEEADRFNDPMKAAKAREEMAAIAEQLGVQVTQRARQGKLDTERARLAVTKAIRYAIRKVERVHPPLGGLLAATVKTGTFCRYEPDPHRPIRWTL